MFVPVATVIATLFASAPLAQALGSANVHNACGYTVTLHNVPASGGGAKEISKQLAPGAAYSQVYRSLSNTGGWAIKLSKANVAGELEFEYTLSGSDVFFDVSTVDGNPFPSYKVSATGGCKPPQNGAGTYPCPSSDSISIKLCS